MSNATAAFGVTIAKHIAGTTSYTPVTLYLGLAEQTVNTATNLEAGDATNEITGTDYARQAVTFVEGAGGVPENQSAISFTAGSGGWPTAGYWFLANTDVEGADTIVMYGALSQNRTLGAGDTLRYAAGAFTLTAT